MKLITKLLCVLLLASFYMSTTYSQAPNFLWSKRIGGTGLDFGDCITVDQNGNIYLGGEFTGTVNFGNGYTLTSAGNVDFVVVKMDSVGNTIWAAKGGGTLTDRCYGIKTDLAGNVYATGHYYGASTFGTIPLTSAGNTDGVTIKYDANGNIVWVKDSKSVSQIYLNGIDVDKDGNSYVIGYFGAANGLTAVYDTITLTTNGLRDISLVKYDTNGNIQWARNMGGPSASETGNSVCVDNKGYVYITGACMDSAKFGGTMLSTAGLTDMFVAKYTTDGGLVWVKSAGGLKNDEGKVISVDTSGNVYVAGKYDSAATFETTSLVSNGSTDAFVAKYSSDGTFQWVKSYGSTGADGAYGIKCDKDGNPVVTGSFYNIVDFGGNPLTSHGATYDDVYILQLDGNGNVLWAKSAGGNDIDRPNGMTLDLKNNIYCTGKFKTTAYYGSDTLVSAGVEDMFISKLGNKTVPVELTSFSAKVNNNIVSLSWMTSTETNNNGFNIERNNGTKWESVAFIKGNGTTTKVSKYNYSDKVSSGNYQYRLKQIDNDGTYEYSKSVNVTVNVPKVFSLQQNYPNPFNPSTVISFNVPVDSKAVLNVYNVLGQKVAQLFNGNAASGETKVNFSATNLNSGVYFYQIEAKGIDGSNFTSVKKMILSK